VIHLSAFLLYLGAFALWILLLWRGARGRWGRVASVATGLAVLMHGGALLHFWRTHGELPLVGPGAALSSLAFVGGLALIAVLPLREAARVALALLPFILLLQAVALALGIEPSPLALDFQGAGFVLHVTLAFLGYQGLALAFAAGMLYLVQHHELKEKRFGKVFAFIPPLATLERIGRVGLWIGFVALTLALAVGWAWTVQNRGSLEFSDPKVLWAVLSWFVFLGILGARMGRGSTEYRSALAAVVGFAVVIGTYLALRMTAGGSGLFL
jgi:HemX protein